MITSLFADIWYAITRRRLRTFLTGFGVAWGIFILVLLLGASGGLEKGILQLFSGFAQNSMWLYGGYSTAEKGNNKFSKQVLFSPELLTKLKENLPDLIESISPEITVNVPARWKDKPVHARMLAVAPGYFRIKLLQPASGRLISSTYDYQAIPVAVIGEQVKNQVFGNKPALGEEIQIGNTFFRIVGILKSGSVFTQTEQNTVFISFQSACLHLGIVQQFGVFGLTLSPHSQTAKAENHLKHYLGRQLDIDADDANALYVFNFDQQVKSFQKLFGGLNAFLWFIGICLLLSGMVGVSNIMFVIVSERTREIGIRKAIGAKRKHILTMILSESAAITMLAGLVGIVLGAAVLSLAELALKQMLDYNFLIRETSIHWGTVAGAMFILAFSGIIAGLLPAQRAAQIEPIEAIRTE